MQINLTSIKKDKSMNNKGNSDGGGLAIAVAITILMHNFIVAYMNVNHHKIQWSSTGIMLKKD